MSCLFAAQQRYAPDSGQRRAKAHASQVADDNGRAGRDALGRNDGLSDDPAVEDFLDTFELGEFGQGRRVAAKMPD